MGRAPCCEKKGMKKGPWTPEEDQILVSYVQQHGHSNWRALPKQAGLLRCGKSCRLRWVNYLKPDIKRGSFTLEEEEAIIKLHEMLGNRWSAIAARLPGRTDNEIKNVWHTHLKKRLEINSQTNQDKQMKKNKTIKPKCSKDEENNKNKMTSEENKYFQAGSPQQSTNTTNSTATEISSFTEASSVEAFPEIDESFWTENLSIDDFEIVSMIEGVDQLEKFGFEERVGGGGVDDEMDHFWYNAFLQAGASAELPEF